MAIAASIFSQRYMRASRFSQAIDTLFKREKTEPAKSHSGIEKDLLELSPMNQMRQTISQFKQQTLFNAELNMKLTTSTEGLSGENGGDPKLQRDLDLMLRMISKDDEEYASLKARFEKLLNLAQNGVSESQSTSNFQTTSEQQITSESQTAVSNSTSGYVFAQANDSQALTTEELSASLARRNSYELNLKFKKNVSIEEKVGLTLEELGIKKVDPLVLDLSGDGINLTEAGKGALFDITADGKLDNTAWVKGNTAMLMYDRNGNGSIDNGSEVFGDQNGAANGFAELAKYDSNKDSKINFLDPVFKALKLYRDLNGDGKVAKNELSSLTEMGIKSLNLNFVRTSADINGNSLILNGSFERQNGSKGQLADVLLGYRQT